SLRSTLQSRSSNAIEDLLCHEEDTDRRHRRSLLSLADIPIRASCLLTDSAGRRSHLLPQQSVDVRPLAARPALGIPRHLVLAEFAFQRFVAQQAARQRRAD